MRILDLPGAQLFRLKGSMRVFGVSARRLLLALLLTLPAAAVGPSGSNVAVAATSTANMTVQLVVTSTCSVNAATLNFGSTGLLASAITGSTSLSVTCSNSTPYSVGLDNGANFSSTRRMRLGATTSYIGYGLYTDAGLTNPWTTASSSTACTTTNSCALGTGNGSAQSITVFGQVPALGTAPAPGTYTDTVTITVTY
jgi:spore coat protein U-like protein